MAGNGADTEYTVRPFEPRDLEQVAGLLKRLRSETIWATLPLPTEVDQESAARWILGEYETSRTFCLYVADMAGTLVGLCGAVLMLHPLIPSFQYVTEWAWYVVPEHRQSRIGARLWLAVCRWGRARGARGSYGASRCQTWSDEGRYQFWGLRNG